MKWRILWDVKGVIIRHIMKFITSLWSYKSVAVVNEPLS